MTGWNLPPGVSSASIPGNSGLDEVIERLCDECKCRDQNEDCPVDFDLETCPVDVVAMAEDRLNGTHDEDSFVEWAKEQAAESEVRHHV